MEDNRYSRKISRMVARNEEKMIKNQAKNKELEEVVPMEGGFVQALPVIASVLAPIVVPMVAKLVSSTLDSLTGKKEGGFLPLDGQGVKEYKKQDSKKLIKDVYEMIQKNDMKGGAELGLPTQLAGKGKRGRKSKMGAAKKYEMPDYESPALAEMNKQLKGFKGGASEDYKPLMKNRAPKGTMQSSSVSGFGLASGPESLTLSRKGGDMCDMCEMKPKKGKGKSGGVKKPNGRALLVKKIMKERSVNLPMASRIIKEEGLMS